MPGPSGGFFICGYGLATPNQRIDQPDAARFAQQRCARSEDQQRRLASVYRGTRVRSRGSVLLGQSNGTNHQTSQATQIAASDSAAPSPSDPFGGFYPTPYDTNDRGPGVDQRMDRYRDQALPLAGRAASQALDDAAVRAEQIEQLVVVSCTGFAAPGLDVRLIGQLGLKPTVGRTVIGFMGCHGAINGLRVAQGLAPNEPGQYVLLCCVELCSLHFQYGWDMQRVVANALFADGAAAMVGNGVDPGVKRLSTAKDPAARPPPDHPASNLVVGQTGSVLIPNSEEAMTWRIGNHGFEMTLSPRVPDLIRTHLRSWIEPWLDEAGLNLADIAGWAIHPGGPKVITAVEDALELENGAGEASRAVLGEHGNMSSPTVLFILQRLQEAGIRGPSVALAFGPGLMAEAALIELR